jgi:integrase
VAQARLDAALKAADSGIVKTRATVTDIMNEALAEYERQGRKSTETAWQRWTAHLEPSLGGLMASRVTTERLSEYATARLAEGAQKATVNREMALLRFAMNHARKARKMAFVPHFPMFRENNVRTGFLSDADYGKLATACGTHGLWLRTMFEVGFQLGWRSSEIKHLRVRQFDVEARTLRLEVGSTKNDEAREAVLPDNLYAMLRECAFGKRPDAHLFARDGEPIKDFRGAWAAATTAAGVPDLLFHDLRRSAVRNLIRRGIPERVAMMITGHKTRAVFDRYNIVSHADLEQAALKMSQPISKHTIDAQSEVRTESSKPN